MASFNPSAKRQPRRFWTPWRASVTRMRTPLQRTRRQRRAAERDEQSHLDHPPRQRWLLNGRRFRAGSRTQAPAGIESAAPWPPLRGKRYALNITAPYTKCRQSPTQLAWWRHRCGLRPARPRGFA